MLVDVDFLVPPEEVTAQLRCIAALSGWGPGADIMPARIGRGMYLAKHWNGWSMSATPLRLKMLDPAFEGFNFEIDRDTVGQDNGVCDTPEQCAARLKLDERPENFVVFFTEVRRSAQPPKDGWEFDAWGTYIGDHIPVANYLYDNPGIDTVFNYHVFEVIPQECWDAQMIAYQARQREKVRQRAAQERKS